MKVVYTPAWLLSLHQCTTICCILTTFLHTTFLGSQSFGQVQYKYRLTFNRDITYSISHSRKITDSIKKQLLINIVAIFPKTKNGYYRMFIESFIQNSLFFFFIYSVCAYKSIIFIDLIVDFIDLLLFVKVNDNRIRQ